MKYKSSKDFFNNEWKNFKSTLDKHVLNGAFFENKNVPANSSSYYIVELEPKVLEKVWVYFMVQVVSEFDELNFVVKTDFLSVSEEIVQTQQKTIKLKTKGEKVYVLTAITNNSTEKIGFIKFNFNFLENVSLEKIRIEFYYIEENKMLEPIIHQDEITTQNLIYWGSFGYGDFGVLQFGEGILIQEF